MAQATGTSMTHAVVSESLFDIDQTEIELTKKSVRQRKRKCQSNEGNPSNESDTEFEAMLVLNDMSDVHQDELSTRKPMKKVVKSRRCIARLNHRRKQQSISTVSVQSDNMNNINDVISAQVGYQTEHQDYCEVCRQAGEVILCDTCPKVYHRVCLDPELEETPQGDWSCSVCMKNGVTVDKRRTAIQQATHENNADDSDHHMELCRVCHDGGELLCCDHCPSSYHMQCLIPRLTIIPVDDWFCPRCTVSIIRRVNSNAFVNHELLIDQTTGTCC
jgi:chromodomain-helicase-DNA-binding protein 4